MFVWLCTIWKQLVYSLTHVCWMLPIVWIHSLFPFVVFDKCFARVSLAMCYMKWLRFQFLWRIYEELFWQLMHLMWWDVFLYAHLVTENVSLNCSPRARGQLTEAKLFHKSNIGGSQCYLCSVKWLACLSLAVSALIMDHLLIQIAV